MALEADSFGVSLEWVAAVENLAKLLNLNNLSSVRMQIGWEKVHRRQNFLAILTFSTSLSFRSFVFLSVSIRLCVKFFSWIHSFEDLFCNGWASPLSLGLVYQLRLSWKFQFRDISPWPLQSCSISWRAAALYIALWSLLGLEFIKFHHEGIQIFAPTNHLVSLTGTC